MKNFALIKDGNIQNIIVADDAFVATIKNDWDKIVKVGTSAGNPRIGDSYSGGKFWSQEDQTEMKVETDEGN